MVSENILVIRSSVINFFELIKKITTENPNCFLYILTSEKIDIEYPQIKQIFIYKYTGIFDLKKIVNDNILNNIFDKIYLLYNNIDGKSYFNVEEIAFKYSKQVYAVNSKNQIIKISRKYYLKKYYFQKISTIKIGIAKPIIYCYYLAIKKLIVIFLK